MSATPMTRPTIVVLLGALLAPVAAAAQEELPARPASTARTDGPWYGVTLPVGPDAEPAVIVGDRRSRPVILPSGEAPARELGAEVLRADLETIVGFSKESRSGREIGDGQLWGRVS